MTNPTRIIKNCETGEETIVELTDEEVAQLEADAAAAQAAREAAEAASELDLDDETDHDDFDADLAE